MTIVLLLALLQAAPDTAITMQGLLGRSPRAWIIALPEPVVIGDARLTQVELRGDSSRWSKYNGYYVEARGRLTGQSFAPAQLREVDPEGTARKTLSTSWSHRVGIVMYALPRRIAWRNAAGQPSGVGPVIVYTMNNHGESDITLEFQSADFMCFQIEPKNGGAPPWHWERRLAEPTDRQKVTLPRFVREFARVPPEAAPEPGTYVVRAGLCGFKEYELETEIEVLR
jgi:hypothetical protein